MIFPRGVGQAAQAADDPFSQIPGYMWFIIAGIVLLVTAVGAGSTKDR